ncbi:MAG TPA: N,N-dimethylformamidase beta subunit family domain-containing protein [Nitrososphaeraceae archaeon]|nr:N,N-dimethylformamidase beta subunit family domain-containing protein [Nitrososphaeraceae archaeon]
MLWLGVIILSATLFFLKINAQEEEEQGEDYYSIYDEYSHNYDKKYFKDNSLKINAITNMTKANNMLLSLHELPDINLDRSQLLASESTIGFVLPTFTMSAYGNNSFYTFYKKYAQVQADEIVTSDLDSLTPSLRNSTDSFYSKKAVGLHHLRDYTSSLLPNAHLIYLADQDIHNGFIFGQDGSNLYDILILGHSEYVTQQEYNNYKKFVEDRGTIILFDANIFYTEVEYDSINNKISLVKGHSWSFDGEKAWRDIKERWADDNTEWVGSNYCGDFCQVTFNNNPFLYNHHEEQYITNPNVKILIDYKAQSQYNFLIAAYELKYGLGKIVSFGIFADDVFMDNNLLSFYQDIILSNI